MKQYLKIRPFDTLFFRNGKPFSSGEVSWTESSLLPNPSVIWGSIFSMMMSHGLIDVKKLKSKIGKEREQELDKLKVGRIFLYEESDERRSLYLPAPFDIYVEKEDKEKQGIFCLTKSNKTQVLSNNMTVHDYLPRPQTSSIVERFEDGFISTVDFTRDDYLYQFSNSKLSVVDRNRLLIRDHKVGIKRNNLTSTAEEGMLYRIDSAQLLGYIYFIVEIELGKHVSNFPKEGGLKLGGEGRSTSFCTSDNIYEIEEMDDELSGIELEEHFRLYLYSPTFFTDGNGVKALDDVGFEVLAASTGKGREIGGFDVLKNQPKPMQRATPEGSVFYLKLKNESLRKVDAVMQLKKALSSDRRGYGLFEILPLKTQ